MMESTNNIGVVNSVGSSIVSGGTTSVNGNIGTVVSSSNFSVLKLEDTVNELNSKFINMWNELANVADYAGPIWGAVKSGDSNLGDAWANVRDAISKFYAKLQELSNSYNEEVKTYIEDTISLELKAALNVDEVANEINDISEQLDDLFNM